MAKRPVKKAKNTLSWLTLCPLVAGVLVTPAALHAASVMALAGTDALTMLYPYVQVVKSPELRMPGELSNPLAQWLMYLQFPVYGLLVTWLWRSRPFIVALGVTVFIHAIGIFLAYLLAYMQTHPLLSF